ncbi:MAG: hypothetical protein SVS85_00015 [Candidatus Nanohaloarchaea archaeon]|nr:hypothetical protein [Candidatus Nanohaloarchaea archaeon]
MDAEERADLWLEEEFEERWSSLVEEDRSERVEMDIEVDAIRGEKQEPVPLAVVERDLPSGLFGFTRRGSSHVVVNRNLYKIDRERTVRHEKTHHRHPKDELTIRYINGDIDVENTLSFRAENPGWSGVIERAVGKDGVAAYGSSRDSYGESY